MDRTVVGPPPLTAAQRRALVRARNHGFVMAGGGFSGAVSPGVLADMRFDRTGVIDRLVALGLLAHGEGWNQYVLTEVGRWRCQKMRMPTIKPKRKRQVEP